MATLQLRQNKKPNKGERVMKKYLPVAVVLGIALTNVGSDASAEDGKVVAGAKKVGNAVTWPFKKVGQGLKAVGKKISGK